MVILRSSLRHYVWASAIKLPNIRVSEQLSTRHSRSQRTQLKLFGPLNAYLDPCRTLLEHNIPVKNLAHEKSNLDHLLHTSVIRYT
ncbi:hypothetical protein CY34DRAFT_184455 [Suillus luteus UH-Slu-Lm8-n1]|uniref:Uncharacterized protein n=1 Tax=Suillus luteus UH-Slu-Lm8-n1 TaxID=930992 RepID=A0A0C9ZVG0_9AGAM|nr:hypothetical protein CY34DRAFT_184455 [Suillus luteus UH-Slu-Lm8-n1]